MEARNQTLHRRFHETSQSQWIQRSRGLPGLMNNERGFVNKNNSLYDLSDEKLIPRIVSGEKELFRLLIDRHQQQILSIIGRQTGDRALSEDLAQEVFVKAFINLKNFRSDSRFSTWLIRIALNHTHSYFRSRNYKEKRKTGGFPERVDPRHDETPEQIFSRRQRMADYRSALSELKPLYREVLILCAFEGRSYEEVAGILEVSVGTVRSRLNQARLTMKDLVQTIRRTENTHE